MNKYLLPLVCLFLFPLLLLSQSNLTYVPDDNFENYLEANGMGDGIPLNDSVLTSAIDTLKILDGIHNQNINDLSGIEDFLSLERLDVESNNLTSLDLSLNINLINLKCRTNQITSLNLSNNILLDYIDCSHNQIQSLDFSNNTSLTHISCFNNQISLIILNGANALTTLLCNENQLSSLDLSSNFCKHNKLK